MNLYRDKILPYLMNKNIGKKEIIELRRNLLKQVEGNILEIGIGTGINLYLYPKEINSITAIDLYVRKLPLTNVSVSLFNDTAEKMHFPDNSFDTVVSTFTLCSTKEIDLALLEIKRVLKSNGKFIFLEHGQSKKDTVRKIQNLFNPIYTCLAYGCNINRNYRNAIEKAGFNIEKYAIKNAKIYPEILTGIIHEGIAIK